MSVDYRASIFVGLHRDDLDPELVEAVWNGDSDLEECPPYYDGGDQALIGFHVQTSGIYSPVELNINDGKIMTLCTRFKELTGLEPKVWLSPYGT